MTCRSDVALVGTDRLPLCANTAFAIAILCCVLGQLIVIYWGPMQSVFGTEALTGSDLCKCAAVASTVVPLDVARKLYSAYGPHRLPCVRPRQFATGYASKKADDGEGDEADFLAPVKSMSVV